MVHISFSRNGFPPLSKEIVVHTCALTDIYFWLSCEYTYQLQEPTSKSPNLIEFHAHYSVDKSLKEVSELMFLQNCSCRRNNRAPNVCEYDFGYLD